MPTNTYFSGKVKSEQNLYEDIVIESLKMYGQETYYLPRTIVERDFILGEPVESQFSDAYMIEMYIENTEGFGGEGDLMSKFGLEIRDTATFIVAKRRWEQLVGFWNNELDIFRPKAGDIIYLPMSKSFFQIDMVEHEQPFYQLQNLPTYKIQCSQFEFAAEDFDTGISEIDRIEELNAYSVTLNLSNLSSTGLLVGETITQGLISGTIAEFNKNSNGSVDAIVHTIKTADGEYREFEVGTGFTASLSGVTGDVSSVEDMQGQSAEAAFDKFASNYEFEEQASDILDFSESNPFGEVE